eukprot:m.13639 g.13639  ORF g.13639 m.13639 type:complete len:95 (+) comp25137_c0_seq1:1079-1363(+)
MQRKPDGRSFIAFLDAPVMISATEAGEKRQTRVLSLIYTPTSTLVDINLSGSENKGFDEHGLPCALALFLCFSCGFSSSERRRRSQTATCYCSN